MHTIYFDNMPPRTNIKRDGKLYIFASDANSKSKLSKYVVQLKEAGYLVKVLKVNDNISKLPYEVRESYKKDFPNGRWGVWVHKKDGWKK